MSFRKFWEKKKMYPKKMSIKIFFLNFFFNFLRIFWNVCRSEFELHFLSKNQLVEINFFPKIEEKKSENCFCIRFKALRIFWSKNSIWPLLRGWGSACHTLGKAPSFSTIGGKNRVFSVDIKQSLRVERRLTY